MEVPDILDWVKPDELSAEIALLRYLPVRNPAASEYPPGECGP